MIDVRTCATRMLLPRRLTNATKLYLESLFEKGSEYQHAGYLGKCIGKLGAARCVSMRNINDRFNAGIAFITSMLMISANGFVAGFVKKREIASRTRRKIIPEFFFFSFLLSFFYRVMRY